ncbi:uncharacterized protein BJ171DRAFT_535080 [Polychytrium aggregatum]|uniref:uncharacterized protein n=1 Tax=Polychytrium aggregatum TaxID=110093 RepID=UPI0022FE11E8|nr:uncharacterized protein BJ171DRAFT_535080 [Polychytrium aggregatum]KAI9193033.1 hypothetical protein BJ171DRAFT_535080 [Polychytrium aggregatum]
MSTLSRAPSTKHRSTASLAGSLPMLFGTARIDADSGLRDRADRAASELSEYSANLLNEPSMGLYRVQEHVHAKVPQLVQHKNDLTQLGKQVSLSNSDLDEAKEILNEMERIQSFENIIKMLREFGQKQKSK